MLDTKPTEEEIFQIAREIRSAAARGAYLEQACSGDEAIRQRVLALLQLAEDEASFLESPPAACIETTDRTRPAERPGDMIGPYKLREQIGEGGFGVVYVAEQEHPVRRKVALKIIKAGMDTKDVIARFEAERQALALMDHPNVAKVLDAGTTGEGSRHTPCAVAEDGTRSVPATLGRPYFVMELVQGVTITDFCDKNSLPTRQRLALFADVCRAVQHAHQKGIIHRDLKPSNIMVTLHDGKPVAKVIDFGVSKALSQQLTEKSIYTAYGQMIGTPSYMSPEQAEMSGLGIDTRSDIYSLGVLLYELLTGQTPLDAKRLRASAYAEILRIIREEEPPRPSLKISTLGEQATVIAQHRHTDPAQLRRDLRGDLDWIVMKCLEKDRARRYETANGLARDIERYLADEPVEACPPSLAYRFSKLARKHRGLITTAASFLALLVVGSIVSAGLAAWALRSQRAAQHALANEQAARREAEAAKEKAEGFSRRLREATQIVNEGLEYQNRGNWAAAYERFAKAEQIEPDLRSVYLHRGELYTTLGLWDKAAQDYDRRFRLASRGSACGTLYQHALLKCYLGDDAGYRKVCQDMLSQFGGSPRNGDIHDWLRACVFSPRPVGDAASLAQRGERLVANWYHPTTLSAAALAHVRAGNFEQAAMRSREALGISTRSIRAGTPILAIALHHLGHEAAARQTLAEADAMIDDGTRQMVDGAPGSLPVEWFKWLELCLLHREATTLITGAPPAEDPRLVMIRERALAAIHYGDAFTHMEAGREQVKRQAWDQAAGSFAKVLDQLPRGFRSSSQEMRFCVEMTQQPEVFERLTKLRQRDARPWYARGRALASAGEWQRAINDLEQTRQLRENELQTAGGRNPGPGKGVAIVSHELAAIRLITGDEVAYRELCDAIELRPSMADVLVCSSYSRALTLVPAADSGGSIPLRLAQQVVALEPGVAWHLYGLGIAQYRAGQYEVAVKTLHESLRVHPAWVGRGQNYVVLAMACHELGRLDEAGQWLAKAQASLDEMNAAIAKNRFGYAASDYFCDWLTLKVLLPEAEALLTR